MNIKESDLIKKEFYGYLGPIVRLRPLGYALNLLLHLLFAYRGEGGRRSSYHIFTQWRGGHSSTYAPLNHTLR